MQGDASGGLDVTLKVAVAALAPTRVEYSLDRRRSSSQIIFMRGAREKKGRWYVAKV